jgi:hypothetical protein
MGFIVKRHSSFTNSFLIAIAISLASCGGGGGGESTSGNINTNSACGSSGASFTVIGDKEVEVGKAAGAGIYGCTTIINNPQWTLTGGTLDKPLAMKSQAIGFDIPAIGSYEFSVSFDDDTGKRQTGSYKVNGIATKNKSTIVARVDQAIRKGGQVSVHAWENLAAGDAVKLISWQQIEGPPATIDTSNANRLLITTPDVAQDTLLKFRVTLETTGGITDSDEVGIVVQNFKQADPTDTTTVFRNAHVSAVYPYHATSPYLSTLVQCVYDPNLRGNSATVLSANLCPLTRLPFFASETAGDIPSVELIMSRVLVSHDWMGEVFERFLRTQDTSGDIRRMLNSVTAIVIGAHIRPSFYAAGTGAIYLDARSLWLTPAQRDTVDETPDPRDTFGDLLQFTGRAWYTSDNSLAAAPITVRSRGTRQISDLVPALSSLLYHELAHANDYLPAKSYTGLNKQISAYDNIVALRANYVSNRLVTDFPLTSSNLKSLAEVNFRGRVPTDIETAYSSSQVINFFTADRANDYYNYSTPREDAAMLIEEFMMAYRHSIRRNIALLDGSPKSQPTGTTAIVKWGQRGRVGEPTIRPRVKLVVSEILPWISPNAIDNLAAPILMRSGETMLQNYNLTSPP